MKLHDLKPAPGSRKARTRVGRGIAAGKGKTAGRGTKGQKSRAGGTIPAWFEGGQTPAHIRLPKLHGFKQRGRIDYQVVNVGRISEYAAAGRFGAEAGSAPLTINSEVLLGAGLISTERRPVKVLGHGDVDTKLFVAADAFTKSARSKIEEAGGFVQLLAPERAPAPEAEPEAGPARRGPRHRQQPSPSPQRRRRKLAARRPHGWRRPSPGRSRSARARRRHAEAPSDERWQRGLTAREGAAELHAETAEPAEDHGEDHGEATAETDAKDRRPTGEPAAKTTAKANRKDSRPQGHREAQRSHSERPTRDRRAGRETHPKPRPPQRPRRDRRAPRRPDGPPRRPPRRPPRKTTAKRPRSATRGSAEPLPPTPAEMPTADLRCRRHADADASAAKRGRTRKPADSADA